MSRSDSLSDHSSYIRCWHDLVFLAPVFYRTVQQIARLSHDYLHISYPHMASLSIAVHISYAGICLLHFGWSFLQIFKRRSVCLGAPLLLLHCLLALSMWTRQVGCQIFAFTTQTSAFRAATPACERVC
jgi:hypothetical protein